MKYRVVQVTEYSYQRPVTHSISQFRLHPLSDDNQVCMSFAGDIRPHVPWYAHHDYWGNEVGTFYVTEAHTQLSLATTSLVEVLAKQAPPASSVTDGGLLGDGVRHRFAEYLIQTPYTQVPASECDRWSDAIWRQAENALDYVLKVQDWMFAEFEYRPGTTTVETTAAQFLATRAGVCQDFAHLMLALCRCRHIPARYVSGYLYCGENAAFRGDGATHAWVEVMMPALGWIGIDPTNRVLVADHHIRVAYGRDYSDVAPMRGVYNGGGQSLEVSVSVHRL